MLSNEERLLDEGVALSLPVKEKVCAFKTTRNSDVYVEYHGKNVSVPISTLKCREIEIGENIDLVYSPETDLIYYPDFGFWRSKYISLFFLAISLYGIVEFFRKK